MPEMPEAGEDHGEAALVGRGDPPVVAHPPTRLARGALSQRRLVPKQTSDEVYGTDGEIEIVGEIARMVEMELETRPP
jgi:hypothetical protein